MAEEINDRLAVRVRKKREEAEAKNRAAASGGLPPAADTPAPVVPPVPVAATVAPVVSGAVPAPSPAYVPPPAIAPVKNFPSESFSPAQLAAIKDLRDAIALEQNVMVIARKLALLVTGRGMRGEVAAAIGKSKSWVIKKMLLLEAPKEVQLLLERGELAESAYHDDRTSLVAGVKGRGAGVRFQREPRGKVGKTAMLHVAQIFQDIAAQHHLSPIKLGDKVSLTDLEYILNTRAGEIRSVFKADKK